MLLAPAHPHALGDHIKLYSLYSSCHYIITYNRSENLATQEEGEAAESDEEDQSQVSFMPNTMVCSTMVSGEASETDDEDEDVQHSVKFSDDGIHADAKADPPDEHEGEDLHHTKPDLQKPRKQKIVYKFDS